MQMCSFKGVMARNYKEYTELRGSQLVKVLYKQEDLSLIGSTCTNKQTSKPKNPGIETCL